MWDKLKDIIDSIPPIPDPFDTILVSQTTFDKLRFNIKSVAHNKICGITVYPHSLIPNDKIAYFYKGELVKIE